MEEEHAVLEEQSAAFESKYQRAKMQKARVEEKLHQQKEVKLEEASHGIS